MLVFRHLKPYYWPYRFTLLAATLSMALLTATGLLRPVVTRAVIDEVVLAGRYSLLPGLVAAVLAIALVRGVFNYGRQYLGEKFGQQVVYDLRNALYHKLQSLPFSYYDRAQTGNLMSRLTGDVEALRMFLGFGLVFLADFVFMIGFSVVVMVSIHARLTWVTLALMPLLGLSAWSFERRVRPAFADVREAMAQLTATLQESITGVRTVKSFAREGHEIDKFSGKNLGFLDRNLNAARLWSTYFPVMEFIGNSTTVLLIWYGGRLVVSGELSLGSLVAFFSLIWYLIWPVRELGFLMNLLTQAIAAGDRLLEILDAPESIADRPGAVEWGECRGHVRFENVRLRYPESSAARSGGAGLADHESLMREGGIYRDLIEAQYRLFEAG